MEFEASRLHAAERYYIRNLKVFSNYQKIEKGQSQIQRGNRK